MKNKTKQNSSKRNGSWKSFFFFGSVISVSIDISINWPHIYF